MVVIAARGQEGGAVALARRIEADGAAVETVGLREIADAQMHVADAQAVRRAGVVGDARIGQRQQAVDIELVGRHRDRCRRSISRARDRDRHRPRCRCLRDRRDRRIR